MLRKEGDIGSYLIKLHDMFLKEQNRVRLWGLEISDIFSTLFNMQEVSLTRNNASSNRPLRSRHKIDSNSFKNELTDDEGSVDEYTADEGIKPIRNKYFVKNDPSNYLKLEDDSIPTDGDDDFTARTNRYVSQTPKQTPTCTFENCGRELSSRKSLRRHIQNIHDTKPLKSDVERKLEKDISKRYSEAPYNPNFEHRKRFDCPDCSTNLASMKGLRRHQKNLHPNGTNLGKVGNPKLWKMNRESNEEGKIDSEEPLQVLD